MHTSFHSIAVAVLLAAVSFGLTACDQYTVKSSLLIGPEGTAVMNIDPEYSRSIDLTNAGPAAANAQVVDAEQRAIEGHELPVGTSRRVALTNAAAIIVRNLSTTERTTVAYTLKGADGLYLRTDLSNANQDAFLSQSADR